MKLDCNHKRARIETKSRCEANGKRGHDDGHRIVGNDLGQFVAGADFGFTRREESALMLAGLKRVKRSTDLMEDPVKTLHTEGRIAGLNRHDVDAATRAETVPFGLEELISQYFQLLSGAK